MSASDNLGQQFSTWYHGTSMERAKSIQKSGLRADAYGMTHGEVNNPTLTTDKRAARVWIPHFVQGVRERPRLRSLIQERSTLTIISGKRGRLFLW